MSWIPNPLFAEELAADVETKAVMKTFAETALAGAQAAAAVQSGHFRDSLFADETCIGSTSSFWAFQEYGSVHNSPTAPLRRGVEAAGVPWSDP